MKLYCIVYCILCSLLCTPMHNVHSLLKGTPRLPEVLHEFMPRSNCSAPIPPRGSSVVREKMCVMKKGGALEDKVKKGGKLENEGIKRTN